MNQRCYYILKHRENKTFVRGKRDDAQLFQKTTRSFGYIDNLFGYRPTKG